MSNSVCLQNVDKHHNPEKHITDAINVFDEQSLNREKVNSSDRDVKHETHVPESSALTYSSKIQRTVQNSTDCPEVEVVTEVNTYESNGGNSDASLEGTVAVDISVARSSECKSDLQAISTEDITNETRSALFTGEKFFDEPENEETNSENSKKQTDEIDAESSVIRMCRLQTKSEIIFVNENGEEVYTNQKQHATVKYARKYPCDFPGCEWVFTRSNHIVRHQMRAHPGYKSTANEEEKCFTCDQPGCEERFRSLGLLTKHKRCIHLQSLLQLEDGQKAEGMQLRSSTTKILYSPTLEPYVCEIPDCGQRFMKRDQWRRHFQKVHEQPAICDVPTAEDNNTSAMQEPKVKKSRRPFLCDEENCAKSFAKHAQLIKHKVQSHDYEKVPRKSKPEGFNGSSQHTPPPKDPVERPYVCSHDNCGWSFKRSYHLERHLESHQRRLKSNETKVVQGPATDEHDNNSKTNEWQSRLRQNKPLTIKYVETIALAVEKEKIKEPDCERPFQCDFPGCGKRFKKPAHLEVHYNVHSGPSGDQIKRAPPKKRPYGESDELNNEEDGYEGEGEENVDSNDILRRRRKKKKEKGAYTCDVDGCEKKFSRNCELTRHKLNHIDVWPFTCEFPGCGRKFKRKDIYRNHQKTHNKPVDVDGKPKSKPRKKPKTMPVTLPQCTELWSAVGTWPETSINPTSVSISIINVTLPTQNPSIPTLTQTSATSSHQFPQSIPQMQNWTQQGRPTVVQQNWGQSVNVNVAPVTSQNWPAVVTRPSVVQATWSNSVRHPEPQNQIVSNPSVLETLGLRPSGLATSNHWITIANNQEHETTLPQCRYTTSQEPVACHPEQRDAWTLQ
ncbi:zinc finger protein-like protein [Leptotrombidium deliense]|uniref:Zinc finger protein-like protein n=1 Tax=Leptotrombidium deliense TaxID=299467 RepID=A0A443SCS4_9ACAR|nr:zinc finger protein-like protein [Leptotrombidium deliense]